MAKATEKKAAPKAAAPKEAPKAAKAPAAKAPAAKASAKPTAAAKAPAAVKPKSDKPNALQQPLTPSKDLAAVVGAGQMARGAVVSKVWEYIRTHNLQNPANKREILADDKLKKIFGKDKCSMFEMNKHIATHLK